MVRIYCRECREVSTEEAEEMIENDVKFDIDDRHLIYDYPTDHTLEKYYNYIATIQNISQMNDIGKYKYMVHLGFVPLVMAPLFYGDSLHQLVIPRLEHRGIPYKKLRASSFNQSVYTNPNPDIWVSKMDCAEMCRCAPYDVTVRKIMEVLCENK